MARALQQARDAAPVCYIPAMSSSTLSQLYDDLIVRRLQYFSGTDENSVRASHVGKQSNYCTASFLLFEIVKCDRSRSDLCVHVNGSVKRVVSRIEEGIATARQRGKRYCWFPVKLYRNEFHPHANALFVDTEQNASWLFEPHGSDPAHPLHGAGFLHLYNAAQYYTLCRELMQSAFPDSLFYSPADYRPGVFSHSVSRLGTGDGIADRFCVFWALYFFLEATQRSPCEFVAMILQAHLSGNLRALVHAALVDMSHNIHAAMR